MSAEVFRAPMRPRDRELPPGAGADWGVDVGLVGIGDALPAIPASLDDAVAAAAREHGARAGRMLERFAAVPGGAVVWTRTSEGTFRRGVVIGPWRYEAGSPVGVVHVRPCAWSDEAAGRDAVPAAVAAAFARGGRNFQRIRDA